MSDKRKAFRPRAGAGDLQLSERLLIAAPNRPDCRAGRRVWQQKSGRREDEKQRDAIEPTECVPRA
jgi:hypothetical protein